MEEILRQILGKRLTSVAGAFHVYEERVSPVPISVWLAFDGAPPYRFRGASDGWHLVVDEGVPKEIDMQESGSVRIRDMRGEGPFPKILNQRVRRSWLVLSPGLGDIIGVRLDFRIAAVRILNWGDEMYVAESLPADTGPNEIIERPVR